MEKATPGLGGAEVRLRTNQSRLDTSTHYGDKEVLIDVSDHQMPDGSVYTGQISSLSSLKNGKGT